MINITSILFQDEYTGSILSPIYAYDVGTPVFMGSVGDKIVATITGNIQWGSTDISVVSASGAKTITRNDGLSFITTDNFVVGDSIHISGTTTIDGDFTIAALSDTVITVNESISSGTFANANIAGTTPMNSFNLYYCLNSESGINSLTDTVPQKLTSDIEVIDVENPSNTAYLFPNGQSIAWYDGGELSTINGSNNTTGIQSFTIHLHFYIKPFWLADQLNSLKQLQSGKSVPPSYFAGDNTLNFNLKLDAKPKSVYPTRFTTTYNVPGNVGWFNEFLNGQQSYNQVTASDLSCGNTVDWKFVSVEYTDHLTGLPVTGVDYGRDTDVTLVLKVLEDETITSAANSAWENAPFVLNFLWATQSQGNYQNKNCIITEPNGPLPIGTGGKDFVNYRSLIYHDRCFTTVGAAPANGDRYGSDLQVIKNVNSSILSYGASGNKCQITFTTSLGSDVKSSVSGGDNNYILWVTPQSAFNAPHLEGVTTLETTDRNAVLCDVNKFIHYTQDQTQLTGSLSFYRDNLQVPRNVYDGVAGDYGLLYMDFTVPAGSEIQSVQVRFDVGVTDLSNVLLETFNLQNWNNVTTSYFNGTFTDINITQPNNFNISSSSPFNIKQIVRNPAGDIYYGTSISRYAYKLSYGFQVGYQWWLSLPTVNPKFRTFATQYWPVYTQGTVPNIPAVRPPGYDSLISATVLINVNDNGIVSNFTGTGLVRAWDSLRYTNVTTEISTFDLIGNNLQGNVLNGQKTKVEIVFSSPSFATITGNPVGYLTFEYQSPNGQIFDTILTTDTSVETSNSLWVAPITIIKTTYGSDTIYTVTGVLDTSLLGFPLTTGYILYGNVTFQPLAPNYVDAAEDLVLDVANNVSIINFVDAGQNEILSIGGQSLINFIDAGENIVL